MWKRARHLVVLAVLAGGACHAGAAPVTWADWALAASGSVTGTIGGVSVTYTGPYAFAQTGIGTNYWAEGTPAPYTGNAVIDNAPTPAEMIALNAAGTHTLTFGSAILNPVFAIVSMGRTTLPVTYDFDQDFDILSNGIGYWSGGATGALSENDATDTLTGAEAHAAIQFNGLLSSISWTSAPGENWHGITVGEVAVPAPAGVALLGIGLILLARSRR